MMRQNLFWAVMALVLAWHTVAHGQGTSPKTASTPATAAPIQVQQPIAPKDLTEIAARLSAIDSAIAKLTEKTGKADYIPGIMSLFGVLIGGLIGGVITFFTQNRLVTHTKELAEAKAAQERELAEQRAKLEIGNSFVQWQLRQLSELYGPLHALFRQSNALYRHMNAVLVKADQARFQLREGLPGDDFDNMVFEINLSGKWVRFRTIMHIDAVYGRNYGIEDYFDELVAIGGRIVKFITEQAGYVRPDQPDLFVVFGKYLAHYSVLNRLHTSRKTKYEASNQGGDALKQGHDASGPDIIVDESAVFPHKIQGLVETGYEAITRELTEWRVKAIA